MAAGRGLATRLILIAVLVASVTACAADTDDPRPAPQAGQSVSDFPLFDMDGKLHRLSDYREPVIVINFWAFWCDTWQKQLGQLRELARQQEELGFRLIVVSVDGQWSDMQKAHLRRIREEGELGFPVLLDGQKVLAGRLGLRRVPTVMVLDRGRRVRWVHEAYPGNPAVLGAVRKAF
ncbi:MAG: TlpA disulfide reductase family protein [Armatimonadia bacterium]